MIDPSRIGESPLFSATWYRQWYPGTGDDLVREYIESGGRGGADPHPMFATEWYVRRYPESASWPTPLHHFLEVGPTDGVDPHPLFDSAWYRSRTPMPHSEIPAEHYLRSGGESDPHPLFSTTHYHQQTFSDDTFDETPLVHYLTKGSLRGVSPSPMVDLADLHERLPATGMLDPLTFVLAKSSLGELFDLPLPLSQSAVLDSKNRAALEPEWKWEYLAEGQWRWQQTFVLTRIVGNDLPPRHTHGQTLDNVRFILENEEPLEGCQKRWVVNRIVDAPYERELCALLESFDQDYSVIPFDQGSYRQIGWRFDDFEEPGITLGRYPPGVTDQNLPIARDHLYHDKNLYVMNNNGARNVALDEGRGLATWVLPFDGNCFFTEHAWAGLREAVTSQPYMRYLIVPMARVTSNEALLDASLVPSADQEPQVVFRWDAAERFNEQARYGRRPKVDLFFRLEVPGPWDRWKFHRWEDGRPEPSREAGRWATAGWVARLFSGRAELESDIVDRGANRIEAIRTCIDTLDLGLAREAYGPSELLTIDERILADQRQRWQSGEPTMRAFVDQLCRAADEYLERGLPSVMDKSTVAPSGDRHDYWHPAPYWWPDPESSTGLPYVQRDGERVVGTEIGGPGSDRYDRTALQLVLDGVFVLSLAGYMSDERTYQQHAAQMLETWFLAPATRMNPHFRYAQVRRGHDDDEGQATGIIELSDIHHVLDAVRLLERSGSFTQGSAMQQWLQDYRGWLHQSAQGRKERAAPNNHGTWYDAQDVAISAYLGDLRGVLSALRRSEERLREQFAEDGHQPHEARRMTSLHYHTYNLQAFVVLCNIADRVGLDLWGSQVGSHRPIEHGLRWLLRHRKRDWTLPQTKPFDHDRLLILAHQVKIGYPELVSGLTPRSALRLRPRVSPHYGIRPFWQLGLAGTDSATSSTLRKVSTR